MKLRTLFRYLLLTVIGIVSFVILFVLFSVAPVDRTPVTELDAYTQMMHQLDTLDIAPVKPDHGFVVGFGKVNITPAEPISTAGYGSRKGQPYYNVHDSIYIRSMVIDNGAARVAIVAADLLIIPPTVTRVLDAKLRTIGFSLQNTYLGATHSHNSIGHWGEGATKFIYGAYEDSVVQFIADGIVRSISVAMKSGLPATLRQGAMPVPDAVRNRLIDNGEVDPLLRVIEVERSDSSRLVMMSYTAHATCLSQRTVELSRDYPGMLVDALESRDYDFAMFLAGAVGSHTESAPSANWECMRWMADEITDVFFAQRRTLEVVQDSTLVMTTVPLSLSDPQVKIDPDWKLRAWLFRAAFGEYDTFLTALRIGDVVMLGTPCDFSGEFDASLDSIAQQRGYDAMVTSFNGGYIGYLTPKQYYDVDHYETQLMNWYAPGTGNYVRDCLARLMTAVTATR